VNYVNNGKSYDVGTMGFPLDDLLVKGQGRNPLIRFILIENGDRFEVGMDAKGGLF